MKDYVSSVLSRLKNRSVLLEVSYQQCLQLLMQEEFLRRLSFSKYSHALILKGGLFIYILTNFESRSTLDVDFLLQNFPGSLKNIQSMIQEIIDSPSSNDFIHFKIVGCHKITPEKKYQGTCVQLIGMIRNIRVPFHIDIGIGDMIWPCPIERKVNTQLPEFESPIIYTYSLESTIAEKFEAILQRFELSSRMKDFYDIYYLSRCFDFDGRELQHAINETIIHRHTKYNKDSLIHLKSLALNKDMELRWQSFVHTINDEELSFSIVIEGIYYFLFPIWLCIINDSVCMKKWNSCLCIWMGKEM
ncbi:MAG: nucleotidyl transferase AbiEii/AbiGii toxin family protein [Erysipelotrichaceae bacterium]|nr:nucleotidyl transferase AbiEii/AbiGii toxin family protein [Erysipelotrichaceae bacterium]